MDAAPALILPPAALRVICALEDAGFEAWAVGGFVRDSILGRPVSDVDIACSARWEQTKAACEQAGMRVHETGAAHGTVTVVADGEAFEVTTFRSDGTYSDKRHPDHVEFVASIQKDLARRDFTVNALAYHPERGLVDPFGGASDIRSRIIRTVGKPQTRFSEDALRILRACRFASQLGFDIEPDTYQAMTECKSELLAVSRERVTAELQKLLLGEHVRAALLGTVDVLSMVLPELVAMKDFDQHTPYHAYDVLEHTARAVEAAPFQPLVRWCALFHDMGKPAAFFQTETGRGHFYRHAKISVQLARCAMGRLTLSPSFVEKVLLLVEHHDDVVPETPRAVKRMAHRLGDSPELFEALCAMQRADAAAQAPAFSAERMRHADALKRIFEQIQQDDAVFSLRQLAVNGRDVMDAGVRQGPAVGAVLDRVLEAVIEEEVPNDRTALLSYINHLLPEIDDLLTRRFSEISKK